MRGNVVASFYWPNDAQERETSFCHLFLHLFVTIVWERVPATLVLLYAIFPCILARVYFQKSNIWPYGHKATTLRLDLYYWIKGFFVFGTHLIKGFSVFGTHFECGLVAWFIWQTPQKGGFCVTDIIQDKKIIWRAENFVMPCQHITTPISSSDGSCNCNSNPRLLKPAPPQTAPSHRWLAISSSLPIPSQSNPIHQIHHRPPCLYL
jgi:hypothetical protein